MPVIAVVNRKGGSGKSTFAAHVAAWCARQGHAVMLGDVDRQQSSRTWLRRRPPQLASIAPWALDNKNVLRVPAGITHVVLDTPGGLHGFELARVVMFADAIVMPVCGSIFDRESAAQCHAELTALPRVASGRCRLAAVGMRVDGRTKAGDVLRQWAADLKLPYLGTLRETQLYVKTLERGLTIFDLPPTESATDRAQWASILEWLQPLVEAPVAANDLPGSPHQSGRVASSRPSTLLPAQEGLLPGARLGVTPAMKTTSGVLKPARSTVGARQASEPTIPGFLRSGG